MDIYNENWELLPTEPDLTLGYLEERTRTIHHNAVAGVTEVWHYETVREYPNGGKDVRKVVDVPGVQAQDAYDETQTLTVYVPYTQAELDEIEGLTVDRNIEAGEFFDVPAGSYLAVMAIARGEKVSKRNAQPMTYAEYLRTMKGEK